MSCEHYRITEETKYLTDFEQGIRFAMTGKRITKEKVKVAHCWGTKECEECQCGGDPSKCDFYPEVRAEAKRTEVNKRAVTSPWVWISIEKKLPELGVGVLVALSDGRVTIDSRYNESEIYKGEWTHNSNVTHWMPLPEPPKGDGLR